MPPDEPARTGDAPVERVSERRLAAVLAADVVGFSARTREDEDAAVEAAGRLQERVEDTVPLRGGRVVKYMGDGVLCEFPSLQGAVAAALALQERFADDDLGLRLRVGVHSGEIVLAPDGDMFGEAVNRASRIEALAKPGGVALSGEALAALEGIPWVVPGEITDHEIKGYPEPVKVAHLDLSLSRPPEVEAGRLERWGTALLAATALAVVVSGILAVVGWMRLGAETYLVLWAAVAGAFYFLFDKAEESVSPTVRAETVRWLKGASPGSVMAGVPEVFQIMFDKLFGERHLAWKCFYRSCFVSLIAVGVGLTLWLVTRPEARLLASEPAFLRSAVWLVFFAGLFNFLPDYVSLLETRWVLGWLARKGRLWSLLLLDLVFTAAISFGFIRFGMRLMYGSVVLSRGDLPIFAEVDLSAFGQQFIDLVTLGEGYGSVEIHLAVVGSQVHGEIPIPVGIFFYSAFVTSIWLWLFTASTLLVRGLDGMGRRARPILGILNYQAAPFRVLGYMSAVLVSGIFVAGLPFVLR